MSEVQTITIAPAEAIELQEIPPSTAVDAINQETPKKRGNLQIASIFIALNLAVFVSALNDTVLATAIPTISRDLDSATGYAWIGGAYLLANAATAAIWAKFSDIWGRKPILLTALTIFFGGSIVCAQAVNMSMLLAGRALQGVAGGGMFNLVMIIVSDIFSVRARSLFLGLIATTWAIAGAVGPILGGTLTQLATWRWCFYINLPASGIAFLMLLIFLDVHNPRTKLIDGLKAVDWLGSVSLVAMVLMVLLGLDFGGAIFPWNSPTVVSLLVVGAACCFLFYAIERWWAKYPVVPLKVFRNWSNTSCYLVAFFQSFVFIGGDYYLPLYFQSVKSASPLESGILTIPTTLAEALAALTTGFLVHRIGRYQGLMWFATAIMTLGFGLYINIGVSSSSAAIVIPQIVAGIGAGCLFDPPFIALHANIAQEDVASASAAMGTMRSIGTAISIVIGGVVFQNGMASQRDELARAGLAEDLIERIAGASAAANIEEIALIQDPAQQLAAKEAASLSIRNMWIMYTCVSSLALLASFFVKKHVLNQEHTETKTGLRKED